MLSSFTTTEVQDLRAGLQRSWVEVLRKPANIEMMDSALSAIVFQDSPVHDICTLSVRPRAGSGDYAQASEENR